MKAGESGGMGPQYHVLRRKEEFHSQEEKRREVSSAAIIERWKEREKRPTL